jgi:hypothetical protein
MIPFWKRVTYDTWTTIAIMPSMERSVEGMSLGRRLGKFLLWHS